MTKFYHDGDGNYIGGYDGSDPPAGAIEVDHAPDDARMIWGGSDWLPLPVDWVAAIADARFSHEVAGTTVNGMAVYTDRTTQAKLTGAALRASRDSTYTVDWKVIVGDTVSFVALDAPTILAVADAVGDYVQACYTREGELVAAVAAGTFTESMLTEGWPT